MIFRKCHRSGNPAGELVSLLKKSAKMKNSILYCFLLLSLLLTIEPAFGQGQRIDVGTFSGLGLGISATVYIKKGNTHEVRIDASERLLENVETKVKNGKLSIGLRNKNMNNYGKVTIYVTMPTVENLSIGGSGKIVAQNAFQGLKDLDLSIGGSGTIEFAGSARRVQISIAGSGDIKAAELKVESCQVSIAGSGDAYIEVSEDLDVSIAGSGDVHYRGRPRVKSSIAGSGSLRSL